MGIGLGRGWEFVVLFFVTLLIVFFLESDKEAVFESIFIYCTLFWLWLCVSARGGHGRTSLMGGGGGCVLYRDKNRDRNKESMRDSRQKDKIHQHIRHKKRQS